MTIGDMIENARRLRADAIRRKLLLAEDAKQFCATGPGGGVDPSCGSGRGGGGAGAEARTGAGSYESYDDRIEGTQAEADREVKRTGKAVTKAKKALDTAVAARAAFVAKQEAVIESLKSDLEAIQKKKADLQAQLEASKARMAALKAQLKKKSAESDLDDELEVMKKITKDFRDLYDEVDNFMDRIETELGDE